MTSVQKTCVICSEAFTVPHWRENTAVTCSLKCRGALIAKQYADKRAGVVCKGCGETFFVPRCHAQRRIYCSAKCALPARSANVSNKGDKSPAWKGGTSHHYDGYLYVTIPEHPFGGDRSTGYVFEHRVVMETWMREVAPEHEFLVLVNGVMYLRPGIIVHHINEVKTDNRRANLLVCTMAAHMAIHNGGVPMSSEVWPEIEGLKPYKPRKVVRCCEFCESSFTAKRSDVERGGGKFCSRKCYNERDRKKFKVEFL